MARRVWFALILCMAVTLPCASGTTNGTTIHNFDYVGLNLINSYRQKHVADPVTWDTDLAQFSQSWAEYLVESGRFEHSTSLYGENLAMMRPGNNPNITQSVLNAIRLWYEEVANYNYSRPIFAMNTGHFTQLVWRGTRTVGIGYAMNARTLIICASFYPPGNVAGHFSNNVFGIATPPPPRIITRSRKMLPPSPTRQR